MSCLSLLVGTQKVCGCFVCDSPCMPGLVLLWSRDIFHQLEVICALKGFTTWAGLHVECGCLGSWDDEQRLRCESLHVPLSSPIRASLQNHSHGMVWVGMDL